MKRKIYFSKEGFTLAEVLITLGIIGIVAAMTLPILIGNYKKKVTATRLKKSYSVVMQALERAKVDHGDFSEWPGLSSVYGSTENEAAMMETLAYTYILPYIKYSGTPQYTTLKKFGYESLGNLQSVFMDTAKLGFITLADGSLLILDFDTNEPEDGDIHNPNIVFTDISFFVDVNGLQKPNNFGEDFFTFRLDTRKGKFGYQSTDLTRSQIRQKCIDTDERGYYCGYLIMMDGWEIKDDYPFKI